MRPSHTSQKRFPIGFLTASLALPLVAGFTGCSPQDFEEFLGDVRDSTSPATGVAIPFEEFNDDVGARGATEVRVLIRTRQGYQDFFGHAPPAGVDMSHDWVIFYGAGTKLTGGYDANILSLTRSHQIVTGVTELVSPGADCAVTQSLTAPHILIKFAAQLGAAIDFAKKDSVHSCASGCAPILCGPGTHCEAHDVVCIKAPCPPVAECVPNAASIHCGGIAGIPCPGNGSCVDDPSDSCDPDTGGADCGGLCQCVQNVLCVQGAVFDNSPKVCACVLQPPVCGPVCDIFCEFGHVLDDKGCPTCKCNPPPTPPVQCGGFGGFPCPGNGKCVDDPSDSCDPNAGGADCGGICQCVQNVLCVQGAVFDSSPRVCACVLKVPPTTCGPVCQIFCAYGNVPDAQGCPTCKCNPPPQPATCPTEKCPLPAPKSVNFTCPDGKTIGGPACVVSADGTCGWTIVACPA